MTALVPTLMGELYRGSVGGRYISLHVQILFPKLES